MENIILIPGNTGYNTQQCGRTMTVRDLIDELNNYDEDTKIYISTGQRTGVLFSSLKMIETEENENYE